MEAFRDEASQNRRRFEEAQATLDASRDLYAELYDYAPIGYVTLDVSGLIENINQTAARMLERNRSHIVGTPFINVVSPEDWPRYMDHRVRAANARVMVSEVTLVAAEGRIFPAQLITRESLLPGVGRRRCFLTAILDLSALRRNESERMRLATEEQSSRLRVEAKDRFLAVLSHELRTPLTPVLAALSDPELLQNVPEPLRKTLEMMHRNITIQSRLVEDLLDVSRIEQGKLRLQPAPLDLHQVIEESLALVEGEAQARGVTLVRDLYAEQHWISGDAIRMRQVLWNLLRNAIKFTPAGGTIRVRSINASNDGTITVSVRDTGIGIDPARSGKLFAPFAQLDPGAPEGLGLGLAICQGLVEAHQGAIHAHSEGLGCGSTFEVVLKAIPAPAQAEARRIGKNAVVPATPLRARAAPGPTETQHQEPPPAPGERGLRIMLVEDHRDTAQVMSRLLTRQGYRVQVANCIRDAIELAQQPFDLAISDISLPDGTGLDLMRRLKAIDGAARGIALSGLASEDDIRRSREAGFDQHLAKPIDFQKLLAVIGQITADAGAAYLQ